MLTTNPFDLPDANGDKLREECGIFGVSGMDGAAAAVALGLHALQHRGQEAAGITSFDGRQFHTHRAMGHVAGNFDRDEVIRSLQGDTACGHVRYSTTGETSLRNVQPLYAELASAASRSRITATSRTRCGCAATWSAAGRSSSRPRTPR
jgi:amidophosphoribosyltransferase